MDLIKKVLGFIKKNIVLFLLIAGVLLLVIIFFIVLKSPKDETESTSFQYSSRTERNIADEVKDSFSEYLMYLDENELDIIANEAVMNYRAIIDSGVEYITDEHVSALNMKLRDVLDKYITDDEMSDEEKNALASSINEKILETILKQLQNTTKVDMEAYREDYETLVKSLQQQINELKKMSINIAGQIKDNSNEIQEVKDDIYKNVGKEIVSIKEEMETISGDAGKNGTSGQNGVNGKDGINGIDGKDGANGIDGKDGADGKNGVDGKDGKDGINGRDGKDGANGINGKDGADGKDGVNGKDGADGKTTYIAYADDQKGANFSLVPTESSKFIGTCITSAEQPTEASAYNWQQYRSYVIRSVTDENQNTTIYIN